MLVDTSVWIDYFNGYASPEADARICLRDRLPLLCKDRDFRAISQCFPLRLIET